LAGLVAEDVYGLGELLAHQLVQSLAQDAELHWLIELLNAFNSGKIDVWNALCKQYATQIASFPSVAQALPHLEEKVAILALIELVWSRPAGEFACSNDLHCV
jgi:26S proteasome regulatory subunit N9